MMSSAVWETELSFQFKSLLRLIGFHTSGGMVGENLTEMWLGNIWKTSIKSSIKSISWEPDKPVLGILAFDISRLMSMVVNIWQCLTDRQIVRLREEIANSVGIQRLVSHDEDYLMDLVLAETIQNLESVAKSVAMLGKKCVDPTYHNLDGVFDDPGEIDPKWYGWQYRLKKMDKRVKKMERFVAATEQLYSELDVLEELEQSLRRMEAGATIGRVKVLEFQQKVLWQRQEVKNLREMSPWVRTYEYIVRLLLRSLFTIVERIKYVFGVNQIENAEESKDYDQINSMSAVPQTSRGDKIKLKSRKSHFATIGLRGCVTGGIESPFVGIYPSSCGSSFRSNGDEIKDVCKIPIVYSTLSSAKVSFFNSKRHLLNPPPSTLGYAAYALHYAYVIILIEKLASSPHFISLDARDDLYSMLPSTIRGCLREKLKVFSRSLSSSAANDAELAADWSLAVARILEWLSPLAHNMVRWQSERNFERRRLICGSNVLLVQSLYFAKKVETEAAIVELLMGLNYLTRFGREIDETQSRHSSCSRAYGGFSPPRISYDKVYHAS